VYVNGKVIPVEIVPGIGGGGDKRKWSRVESKYDINATMYPYPAQ
jgi:hypothetical protein